MPFTSKDTLELTVIDANVDSILEDTNEIQGDLKDGGRLDLLIDGIKASTDNLPTDPADASVIVSAFAVTDGKIDVIDAFHDTPSADSADNVIMSDVIGSKSDTSAGTSLVGLVRLIDSIVDAIKAKTDTFPANVADAAVVAASFVTTDGLITTVDTVVDSIKTSTDNLPTDPADASVIAAAFAVTDGKVDAVQGDVTTIDGIVDDILLDTAEIGSAVGASISADIAAIKAVADNGALESSITSLDTLIDGLITTVGVAGLGLSAIPAPTDMALDSTVAKAAALTTVDTVVDGIQTDLDNATDGLGAIKAVVDNGALEATIGSPVGADISTDIAAVQTAVDALGGSGEDKATFSYTDAGSEQTVVELTVTDRKILYGVWLDMVNMTQNGTIKIYYKVDGTNYREVMSESWTTADLDGVYIDLNMGVTDDFKVTYEEDVDEAADRALPYSIVWNKIQ